MTTTTTASLKERTITELWAPTLKSGAPSNAAGMRGYNRLYGTKALALDHEHWNNQAPWASARKVYVYADMLDTIDAGKAFRLKEGFILPDAIAVQ